MAESGAALPAPDKEEERGGAEEEEGNTGRERSARGVPHTSHVDHVAAACANVHAAQTREGATEAAAADAIVLNQNPRQMGQLRVPTRFDVGGTKIASIRPLV